MYLFECCFEALIEIISSWIYCGESNDFYQEISTKQHRNTTIKFDKLPLFLQNLKEDIERSGFCLNILKKCDLNLFHCCFVPNFFDDDNEQNINYPIHAVFKYDEIRMY